MKLVSCSILDDDYAPTGVLAGIGPGPASRTGGGEGINAGCVMEEGSVGTWIGNAVPVGEAVTVDAYAVRVLEVERGWEPGRWGVLRCRRCC